MCRFNGTQNKKMRDLQIIQSRSYLTMMAARTKNEIHQEHLDNCHDQICYLEEWKGKAVVMINDLNQRNIRMEAKVRESESNALKHKSSVDVLKQQIEQLKTEINTLTKNIEI